MNTAYHRRFLSDIRFTTLLVIGLFVAGTGLDQPGIYLFIPLVTLIGACQTAFDPCYLMFSRYYAQALEELVNAMLDRKVLIAHRIEESYLFPSEKPRS